MLLASTLALLPYVRDSDSLFYLNILTVNTVFIFLIAFPENSA